ncbi:uncharacterized protein B0I36DRAFT_352629 [Microdochium trichocladiopsis]|uniref:Uncharacterized protein n=1 Tax=Microdochium trichocladiopsis TaxID=1682393 RepID=A0A9P8XZ88_9PEZI|nr:uncharacterized protein B0I36DRAFT_352629 [Microdochium trichocladiopsis]KAH7024388.1 hypothetical protein B0I36DRAFT_352629 [Microdochium trichocladiopsis]
MSANVTSTMPKPANAYGSESDSDGQARGGRKAQSQLAQTQLTNGLPHLPTSSGLSQPAGQLLKGATDDNGNQKAAALLVGIKLDLEAEVHLTARVRGDICIGLY